MYISIISIKLNSFVIIYHFPVVPNPIDLISFAEAEHKIFFKYVCLFDLLSQLGIVETFL